MLELLNNGFPFCVGGPASPLSPYEARKLRRENRIRPILHGVYVDARVPDSRRIRAVALHLVKPEHAVFFGSTVAFLLGLDVRPPLRRTDLVPECIVPHHATRCTSAGVRCFEGYLHTSDIVHVDGLAVTSPVRTTVDLLRRLRRPHALAAADALCHEGLVTVEEVQSYVGRMVRYPGIVQARSLAPLIDPRSESAGESWTRLRVTDAGLPRPAAQHEVLTRHGVVVARLDLAYPEHLVGIEYDGRFDHSECVDLENDRRREADLQDVYGWRMLRVRSEDILGDSDSFEVGLGAMLGQRPLLPRGW